jgi:hypothetical protein
MSAKRKLLLGLSIISIAIHTPALMTNIYQSIEILQNCSEMDAVLHKNQQDQSELPDPSVVDETYVEQYMFQLEEMRKTMEATSRMIEYSW